MNERGLSKSEAQKRSQEFGFNQLPELQQVSVFHLFFSQFSNLIVWVLIAAAIIAGFLSDWIDAFAIIAIVILNAFLGFFQEYKAEKSLAALRKMVTRSSKVIRDGRLQTVPSKKIVPGDLVLIESGDHIPADGRFLRSYGLSTQEAALTGESIPIHKSDKKNRGFQGTVAVSGKGYMIVTETGIQTELGKIASLLQQGHEEKTLLQKRLQELGSRLVWLCLGVVSLVFAFGYLRGTPLIENLLISISLAVAAIPEGLAAIVTITLSMGVHHMAKRNALIRRLSSVETLGCTTVICTDKTGTLTQNEMTVRSIWVNNTFIDPDGNHEHLMALKIGVLCNNAELRENGIGDPTECALLKVAEKAKLFKGDLEAENPLLFEIPFDSERKKMSMARQTPEGPILFIKGAFDVMLAHSESILINGKIEPLTDEQKKTHYRSKWIPCKPGASRASCRLSPYPSRCQN